MTTNIIDNDTKRKMLRYAQLVFQKQKAQKGGTPLTSPEEDEFALIPTELGLTHVTIIKMVTENLVAKM